jgi:hypothetical protein
MKSRLCILIFILSAFFVPAQVDVHAFLDSSKIRIGEQVKLNLYVTYDANQKNLNINWPTIGDTLTGKVEVISTSAIDTTIPDKNRPSLIQQHQQILISAYDSGYFQIPPFTFTLNNDTSNVLNTRSFILEVHTIPTDTSLAKVKDIKPVLNEPFNWKWYLLHIWVGIGIIALGIAAWLIIRYRKKKMQNRIVEPPKPKIPAHITALESLEKIKSEKVWREGKVKEYYSQISDTIRLYIEERFNVFALESTTDEIMSAFRSQVIDSESKDKLQQMLQLADLVKFAKMIPIEMEHEMTLDNAFDFVNGTKREEVVTIPDTNQPTNGT